MEIWRLAHYYQERATFTIEGAPYGIVACVDSSSEVASHPVTSTTGCIEEARFSNLR